MHRRALIFVVVAAIFMMVLPHVLEIFDTWDKRPEIPVAGHDTESTLMEVGFAAGACIGIAWLCASLTTFAAKILLPLLFSPEPEFAVQPFQTATDYLKLLFSPPVSPPVLRI